MPEQRWLITGASGQLGGHIVDRLRRTLPDADILAWTHSVDADFVGVQIERVDLADPADIKRSVANFCPTHVIHAAAVTAVGEAHADPERTRRVNVDGARCLLEAALARDARFLYISTDMIFDGEHAPYSEDDAPEPLSMYGRSKYEGELAVREAPGVLIVRLPLMYGLPKTPRKTTFGQQMAALRAGQPLRLFTDEFRTPIWLGDAARVAVELTRSNETGVLHAGGPERLSRYELVARCARLLNIEDANLVEFSRTAVDAAEPRPRDLSLNSDRLLQRHPELAPGPIRAEAISD